MLNYTITCNHVHLLVLDTGNQVIGRSMQLIAGRSAQEYNERKNRRGAFWEDRYHATAVEADGHLQPPRSRQASTWHAASSIST